MVLIAFVVYVLSMLLIKFILKGSNEFSEQFFNFLVESVVAAIFFISLYFGFLWYSLKSTLGYLVSDSFDEPTYGHKLSEEFDTRFTDFNSFKDVLLGTYPHVNYSEEKSAIKFFKALNFMSWEVGGIAYFESKTGRVKVILIPFSGYSNSSDKLMNEEMKRLKELLKQ